MMKPTLGRIVLFRIAPGIDRAAIISNIYNDGTVALHVMAMPQDSPSGEPVMAFYSATEGEGIGQWRWPPRAA